MTNNDAIAIVLSSGLSLLGLAYLYLWLYRDYRRDLLRTKLFEIRGELFDGAKEGRIDFNHPAYGLLRSTLNGFLRSGHRVGAWRLFLTALFLDPAELREQFDFGARWQEATRGLEPETLEWLEGLRTKAHRAIDSHLLATTAVVGFMLACALVVLRWDLKPKSQVDTPVCEGQQPKSSHRRSFTYQLDSVALANAA